MAWLRPGVFLGREKADLYSLFCLVSLLLEARIGTICDLNLVEFTGSQNSGVYMSLSAEQKSVVVKDYQREATDTGSPEVQVA